MSVCWVLFAFRQLLRHLKESKEAAYGYIQAISNWAVSLYYCLTPFQHTFCVLAFFEKSKNTRLPISALRF